MSAQPRTASFCLALFLASTLVLGAAAATAEETAPAASAPAATLPGTGPTVVSSQGRIGVIDIGRLLEVSETGRAALAALEAMQDEKKARFEVLAAEGKALETQVQEGELTLAEEKMIALRQELEDKKIEISRFGTDSQRELEEAQREMFGEIQQRVLPIIKDVGREGAFSLIFRKFESGLIFADERVDVTDQVIARLDGTSSPS